MLQIQWYTFKRRARRLTLGDICSLPNGFKNEQCRLARPGPAEHLYAQCPLPGSRSCARDRWNMEGKG